MTTKEFKLRSLSFNLLDRACDLLRIGQPDERFLIYHVIAVDMDNIKYETFLPDYDFTKWLDPALFVKSILIDSFQNSDFKAQFKYFKSFYNRLSVYQKSSLKSSGLCNNLIALYEGSE